MILPWKDNLPGQDGLLLKRQLCLSTKPLEQCLTSIGNHGRHAGGKGCKSLLSIEVCKWLICEPIWCRPYAEHTSEITEKDKLHVPVS